MRPFAVDSNAICEFQKERITREIGVGHEAITKIFVNDCIAMDEGRLCLQEWLDTAGGSHPYALADWVADETVNGRIQIFPLSPNTCRKQLTKLGIPSDDHKWVRLAIGSSGNVIVSGDIDFLDPRKKRANAKTKAAVRDNGSGPCSKALAKIYNIEIKCLERVYELFDE